MSVLICIFYITLLCGQWHAKLLQNEHTPSETIIISTMSTLCQSTPCVSSLSVTDGHSVHIWADQWVNEPEESKSAWTIQFYTPVPGSPRVQEDIWLASPHHCFALTLVGLLSSILRLLYLTLLLSPAHDPF